MTTALPGSIPRPGPGTRERSAVARYGVAILAVAVATALKLSFPEAIGRGTPVSVYLAAVMVAAWFGGLGPGLLATGGLLIAGAYLFVAPYGTFRVFAPYDVVRLVLGAAEGAVVSILAGSLRQARRAAEERYQQIARVTEELATTLDSLGDGVIATDARGAVTRMNPVAEGLTGWPFREASGRALDDVFVIASESTKELVDSPVARVLREGVVVGLANHTVLKARDGRERPIADSGAPIRDPTGRIRGVVLVFRDVSDERSAERVRQQAEAQLLRTEEQLRQAQKMEAVGRLAGGVAHDFNNLLTVILSYADMVLKDVEPTARTRSGVEEIQRAATRAADLTRQLLLFSRQKALAPTVLDLSELVTRMEGMLRRLLGEDIDLALGCPGTLAKVRADPGSIEQVVVNLAVNARDAMPGGGKLTIETGNVVLGDAYAKQHLGVKPGPHVVLAVSDTGTGMDRATQSRIFEPFFTTKGPGKGTGLGLSTVFGIVQQSEGSIWVYSEPGLGTTFKIYFPVADSAVEAPRPSALPAALHGSETILVVEDEEQVRDVARDILERHGYRVLVAAGPGEALLLSEKHPGDIDLLLTDVVMPSMSGPELARRLATSRPAMRLLCMSGYTDDSVVRRGALAAEMAFIEKPFTPETLTTVVRKVLGA